MQAVFCHLFWNRSRDCSVYTTSDDGLLRRTPAQMFQRTWFLFCLFGVEGVKRTAKSSLPLYRNIYSIQDCSILQEYLTSLGQWEADWQKEFNVANCHSMRVTWHQHHKQIHFDYSLHNQISENVQSAKYLGITISDKMDWVKTFQKFLPKQLRHSVFFA